jgi:glycosyltransferase involved in cell wall biosynthesis
MKLLIISGFPHHLAGGRVHGWEPAVREIDSLSGLFDEVRHVAPLYPGPAPAIFAPYSSPKVTLVPITPSGGGSWAKLGILWRSPEYLKTCLREFRRADAVHLRCPANVSLEALLLMAFLKKPRLRWAKYGGNWRPEGHEPIFYRLQRRLLERGILGGAVTVNGEWPQQPAHVFSFHNPCLTKAELRRANLLTRHKRLEEPLRLLFAGQLRATKGADRALRILGGLRKRGWDARLNLAGDGPQAAELRELAARLGLTEYATFHGWLSVGSLQELFRTAHFLLLPTSTEGWPKVIGEAMAFGAVPLAGAVSCIPQILGAAEAGVALPFDDVNRFVREIDALARNPETWQRMAANGQRAAHEFTYEVYMQRLCELLRIGPTGQMSPDATAPNEFSFSSTRPAREAVL